MNVSNSASTVNDGLLHATSALASGKRITSAAVDPAGLAVSEALLTQATSDARGAANAQNAINASTVAAGALASISTDALRLQALAVAGNNAFLTSSDRAALQTQANQTSQEIDSVAQSTNVGGTSVPNGANVSATVQTGAAEGDTATLTLASVGSNALGISNVNLTSSAAATTSETSASAAVATLATAAATLGAQQVRLGLDAQNTQSASVNLTASSADIADTNVNATATSLANALVRQRLQLDVQAHLAANSIASLLLGTPTGG